MASCCHDKCVYEQSMKGSKGGRQRNERWARNWFLGTKIETNKKECNCCVTKRVNPGMFWEKVAISENKVIQRKMNLQHINKKMCIRADKSLVWHWYRPSSRNRNPFVNFHCSWRHKTFCYILTYHLYTQYSHHLHLPSMSTTVKLIVILITL